MEINVFNKLADIACVPSFIYGTVMTTLGAFLGHEMKGLSQVNL